MLTHAESSSSSHLIDCRAARHTVSQESVISYHTWPDGAKPKVVAVAACLQSSTSAVVTLASSGITRPAQLDGKTYASYGARFEGRIVQQMIVNDGGKGDFKESVPPMLGIWNTLLKVCVSAS
jgi:NitT/TauT family transport system substrate-binding protein